MVILQIHIGRNLIIEKYYDIIFHRLVVHLTCDLTNDLKDHGQIFLDGAFDGAHEKTKCWHVAKLKYKNPIMAKLLLKYLKPFEPHNSLLILFS